MEPHEHSVGRRGAEVLLETLFQEGVKYIFTVPGRESEAILFNEAPGLEIVLTAVEFTAGFSAYAYALLTNIPQAVFATIGPGSANLANAIYSARADRVPIVFIAAQVERNRRYYNDTHQCINTIEIYKPIAKYAREVNAVSEISDTVSTAIKIANQETKGPTVISIPIDVLEESCVVFEKSSPQKTNTVDFFHKKTVFEGDSLNTVAIDMAENILRNSRQPLIYVGHEVIRSKCEGEVHSLCKNFQIPLVSAYDAQGILPTGDDLNYFSCTSYAEGILGIELNELVFGPADCIIAFGYDWKDDVFPDMHFSIGKPKQLINFSGCYPKEFQHHFLQVQGNLKDSLTLLLRRLSESSPSFNRPYDITPLREAIRLKKKSTYAPKGLVSIISIMNIINESSGKLIVDVGTFRHYAILLGDVNRTNQFITSAGSSSFGVGLPLGLGTSLVSQNRESKDIVLTGDGGFNSTIGDLRTLKKFDSDVIIIVLNNNKNGLIGIYQEKGQGQIYEPAFLHAKASFAKIAQGYGCEGFEVSSEAEFKDCLTLAFSLRGPIVIEVPIYYPEEDIKSLLSSCGLA